MVCRAVEEPDARALLKTAVGWWPRGTAVLFGMYLALRRTEIACAEWSRFSSDLNWYTVTGKGDKTATLPVHSVLRDELGSVDRSGRWVFEGRFGSHVTPATIWSWSKEVAAAAGIEEFTTHQLRHTALTTANDNLGDLRAVQTFARHKHPDQTAGYTRTKQTRLREVSDSLDYL
jgi:integrase/recombinase XerD